MSKRSGAPSWPTRRAKKANRRRRGNPIYAWTEGGWGPRADVIHHRFVQEVIAAAQTKERP